MSEWVNQSAHADTQQQVAAAVLAVNSVSYFVELKSA